MLTEPSHGENAGVPGPPNSPQGVADFARRVMRAVERNLNGKTAAVETAVTTLLAGGHLLLEDVPGVGKTSLATSLARAVDGSVKRVQFTADMLPTDVTGVSVYDRDSAEFRFHPGPVFANIVIGDEINRATPRTQSALLEAMGEGSVTVDGQTLPLPEPFIVVATQNPHDMAGTFALPEAQRDRFMARIALGYPDPRSEVAMLMTQDGRDTRIDRSRPVASLDDVIAARHQVSGIHLDEKVARYLVGIVAKTRSNSAFTLGASPRAALHLAAMARARAAIQCRTFVAPDDVARLAGTVLPHRLTARGRFATADESFARVSGVVGDIVAATPVP